MNGQDARLATFTSGRLAPPRPASEENAAGSVAADAAGTVGGDAAAWVPPTWEEVVRDHGNRVYRLAYRLTGNAHDAEDLTQDVFVRVFRSLADYTPGTFEGWLHRITTNLFLDRMRRQQKIRFDALPDDPERLAGREASPEAVYAESHFDADIEGALAALPPDFRAAVVLCDIEQLSYEEIAQTLGVKLGTVRSRISRGRAMLRQALADRAPRSSAYLPTAGEAALLAVADEPAGSNAAVSPTAMAGPQSPPMADSRAPADDGAHRPHRSHRIPRRAAAASAPPTTAHVGGATSTPERQA
ncbi:MULTISPECIES: RNA polymerase sigma factor SigE [unclassified Frankia]|uniref:RNA polymerase sigma factor SigE n=1 Tax=unclassified Frankia TaxID=2632575 RepID=UPI0020248FF4